MGWNEQGPGFHPSVVGNAPHVFLVPFGMGSLSLQVRASIPKRRVDVFLEVPHELSDLDTSVAWDTGAVRLLCL